MFEKHKITTYEDNVKSLPDYPSDAGYTAAKLKEIFDGRTDKEIKEKHNGLVDAVGAKIDEIETNIERRVADVDAQFASIETRKLNKDEFESFKATNKTILEGKADREELAIKVDKVSGKGLSSNDFTNERSAAIDDALYEAIYAQAELDRHANDKTNPHKVTAAQIEAYTKHEADINFIPTTAYVADQKYFDGRVTKNEGDIETLKTDVFNISKEYIKNTDYATKEKAGAVKVRSKYGTGCIADTGELFIVPASETDIDARISKYAPIVPSNLEYAVKSVGDDHYATVAQVGEIATALDELHTYAQAIIGGVAE